MEIIVSGIPSGPKVPKENKCFMEAGFNDMLLDLTAFCSQYLLEHKEECYNKYLEERKELKREEEEAPIFLTNEPERMDEAVSRHHIPYLKGSGIKTTVTKAPTLAYRTERDDLDFLLYRLTIESIYLAGKMGSKYIWVDPLVKNVNKAEDMERNRKFYLLFSEIAKKAGLRILIKNYYSLIGGHFVRSDLSSQYMLASFIDRLNDEVGEDIYGLCMDIGVCNLLGQNLYEFCKYLGSRIKVVIMRENDGEKDVSMLPFTAVNNRQTRMDWLSLIRGLRLIEFDGPLIFDFTDTLYAHSHLLWQEVYNIAKVTSDYLVWQLSIENVIRKYPMRILFGAGNMCRNYMKCYGQKFPPLYISDNNEKLWGTIFEGLEIRNPVELRKLPADCAIFICNIYYDEIELQLKEMKLLNPIERFNDEYMPSFYFDRLDAKTRDIR